MSDELEAFRKFADASIPMIAWDAPARCYWPFDDGTSTAIVSAMWSHEKDMYVMLSRNRNDQR